MQLGLLLYPGCMPTGLYAAADLVAACNLRLGRERIRVVWGGLDTQPVAVAQGPALQPQAALGACACEAWLLPGLWLACVDQLGPTLAQHGALIEQLRRLPRRSQVWSYCAGVALLAAAGLLDGREATATWWLLPALAARFPRVHWRDAPTVASGRVVTASGPAGHLPLMLDRLALRFSSEVLYDVQQVLMLPQPRSRHESFNPVEMMALRDPALRQLLAFAQRTPAQALSLASAAEHLNLSVRTLSRRVMAGTGVPAGDWLRRVKLSQVAEALRLTRTPIKAIAADLGFGSEAGLHRAFKLVTGLTPSAYRQAYGETRGDLTPSPG
ncbi:GlxA family transcriptional regulator [Roseateles sp. LKC17W]|uniref:GlxA family transcriptional regulator n=1 Tax=Pelomonas margarita TaxID=3299031 RepID=A0ABW7FMT2_9BURK